MENNKTWTLYKISYHFSQEGNTLGTTSLDEEMIVDVETQLGSIEEEGGFLVIRTEGWSVNDVEELKDMLKLVEDGVCYNGVMLIESETGQRESESIWENRDEVPFVVDTPKVNNILE